MRPTSRSEIAAKGFLTSLFQYASQILLQALLAPIVLRVIGREALGAYAGIMQVVSVLALVDIAHSWSLERFLAQSFGKNDGGLRFREIFTTARTLLLVSNFFFAALVIILSAFIGRLFHLTPAIEHQSRYALYIIAVWSLLRTPLAAYLNASIATQDLSATNLIGAFLATARATTSLVVVLSGGGLFGLMLSGIVAEACGTILYRIRFKKKNPSLMPGWGIPDRALLKEMIGFGGHAMFWNIGNVLVFNSGNALAASSNGAAVASAFYTSQMPTMTGYLMILRLPDNAAPAINEMYGQGDMKQVKVALIRLTRFVLMLALPLGLGVGMFNRDLVTCWVGPRQYAGDLLTITLAIFCVIGALQRVATVFSFVLGWIRVLSATAFIQGIANVVMAWELGRRIGLGGVTLSLVIVVLPQTLILWFRLGRFFDIKIVQLLARTVARLAVPLLLATTLSLLVHSQVIIMQRHFIGLFAETLVFIFTYGGMSYVFLVTGDKRDVNRHLKSFAGLGRNAFQQLHLLLGKSA